MFLLEAVEDIVKLTLIVASVYVMLRLYARNRRPAWSEPLERRRVAILLSLALGSGAIKVLEDVVRGDSGPIDKAVLLFIRDHIPPTFTGLFSAVTSTGSARALAPLTVTATLALLLGRRRQEALLLTASVVAAAATVYVIKTLVGRARPALWKTEWYWGSSFPSGHTLVVAAFATALALAVGRMWPSARGVAFSVATVWVVLVAISRLVLGVHWPTDVLAAACIGASLPFAMAVTLELHRAS